MRQEYGGTNTAALLGVSRQTVYQTIKRERASPEMRARVTTYLNENAKSKEYHFSQVVRSKSGQEFTPMYSGGSLYRDVAEQTLKEKLAAYDISLALASGKYRDRKTAERVLASLHAKSKYENLKPGKRTMYYKVASGGVYNFGRRSSF
jgi:hypothetical protein